MVKRELINKKKLIGKMKQSNAFDISERMKFSNLIEEQRPITEQEIVKPYLDEIRAEIEQLRLHKAQFLTNDNKVCIDSQEVLDILDRYKAESEDRK